MAQLRQQLLNDALQLSRRRQAAAGQLRVSTESCLRDLAMGGSRFDVRVMWEAAAAPHVPGSGARGGRGGGSHALLVPADEAAACGQAVPAAALAQPVESPPRSSNPDTSATSGASGSDVSSGDAASTEQAAAVPPPAGWFRVRPGGLDAAEFLLAAGPSEPLRPLAATASGGESARVMLALKAAPAAAAAACGADSSGSGGSGASGASSSGSGNGSGHGSSSSSSSSPEGSALGAEGGPPILVLDELDSGGGQLAHGAPGNGGGGSGSLSCLTKRAAALRNNEGL